MNTNTLKIVAESLSWGTSFFFALGIGLFVFAVLRTIVTIMSNIFKKRQTSISRMGDRRKTDEQQRNIPSESEMLGLDDIPWDKYYIVSAFVGLFLFMVAGPLIPGVRPVFLVLPGIVYLINKSMLKERRKRMIGQVRRFLIDLRMRLTQHGSVLLAMEDLADRPSEDTPVYHQLKMVFLGGRPPGGEQALQELSERIRSPHLVRLTADMSAYTDGRLDFDAQLQSMITEIGESVQTDIETSLQQAPLRLTIMAMPLLLGPIVVVMLYPVADRLFRVLTGIR